MWKAVLAASHSAATTSQCFHRQFNEAYLKTVGKIKLEITRPIFHYFLNKSKTQRLLLLISKSDRDTVIIDLSRDTFHQWVTRLSLTCKARFNHYRWLILPLPGQCLFQVTVRSLLLSERSYCSTVIMYQYTSIMIEAPLLFVDAVIQCKSRCSK